MGMQLSFIGAGKMATAIAAGLLKTRVFRADELAACEINPAAAAAFESATGIRCCSLENALQSPAILLAVKPQQLSGALEGMQPQLKDKMILSIAAGVGIEALSELTGSADIVRVMPNTPAMYNCGVSAYAGSRNASPKLLELTEKIFKSVGSCYKVEEKLLAAVTGLSGSGPAYVFSFIQALSDGGVAAGLPREMAGEMAVDTVIGAAKMVKESRLHPAILRDMVTSPGGTTARALEALEANAFGATVIKAVRAAADRAEELGKKS